MSNRLGRFQSQDEESYFEKRKNILKKQDAEFVADNPYLFATRQETGDTLARVELFQKICDIPGYIVECGSNTGNHLMLFALLSTVYEPYAINRKIISFDTFDGFRSINTEADGELSERDFSNADFDLLEKCVNIYDMNRHLSHMNKIRLIKGNAVETIPEWKHQNKEVVISLLYLDFDIYEPTVVALENLFELIPKGGIVAFDQFSYENFPGETLAFKEKLGLDYSLKKFSYHPFISYFVK
ncbi:uncharacterized protein METZ01_LOCUS396334 [marine metagenome]|uniref:dTDP-6-deoxy-L-hexose 3-O-methyltransferase n=1 Tax=marine metagenome TaxID=408172 RepID=A0A382VAL1_9ZZZZ